MSEVDQMSYYAYYVDYGYYKIDQNNQSKITVHETDILNFHLMEHFYWQSHVTAVEQITFQDTKMLTIHDHENTLSHPL